MQVYNTLSGQVEPFEDASNVTLYVCGITPYDTTHLGHAFLYVFFDTLIRYLESKGVVVNYTQNVTDIDDDMLRKAAELRMDYLELAQRETARFQRDMQASNPRPPDHYPHATEEIAGIVAMVERLVAQGQAYVRQGNVYFDITSYERYGELSKLNQAEMLPIAAERGGKPNDPLKDDPLDFLLWQATVPGEPNWPSPWGAGRPGWHIECSAMSMRYLGQPVTIHGGGGDLIYPHHESERAQSESFNPAEQFVRYWMHVGMLRYEGEKMSKSLGNLVLVGDLLKTYSSDAVRLALLSHHYRASWEFEQSMIDSAQQLADRLAAALRLQSGAGAPLATSQISEAFAAALDNDFDTPGAVAQLEKLALAIEQASAAGQDIAESQDLLRQQGAILGLTFTPAPATYSATCRAAS